MKINMHISTATDQCSIQKIGTILQQRKRKDITNI